MNPQKLQPTSYKLPSPMLHNHATLQTRRMIALAFAGVILAVLLTFGRTLTHGFVDLDDRLLVTDNPVVREMSPWSLTKDFTTYDPELYVPLTFLSYQIDYVAGGYSAFVYHAHNLILHATNAALVLVFLFLLTDNLALAIAAAFLFAIHPIQTEAVAWISARKDLQSAFFFLVSLIEYLLFRTSNNRWHWAGSIMSFLLGLLSKVSILFLPLMLIQIDREKFHKNLQRTMLDTLPFFALSVIFGFVALGGKTDVLSATHPVETLLMAAKNVTFTFESFFLPVHLSVLYPYTQPISIFSPDFFLPILLCLAIASITVASRKSVPSLLFSGAFFLLTLAPSFLNFAKGGDIFITSDRYAYLPTIALSLFVCSLIQSITKKTSVPSWLQTMSPVGLFVILCSLVLIPLSIAQAGVWQSTETLFLQTQSLYPDFWQSAFALGNAYRAERDYPRAIETYKRAIAEKPTAADPHVNLGGAYREQGHLEEALKEYDTGIALNPHVSAFHYYRALLLVTLKRPQEAVIEYETAIGIRPDYAEALNNVGALYHEFGPQEKERSMYERTIAAEPSFLPAHFNLAAVDLDEGKTDEARMQYQEILRRDPSNAMATKLLQKIEHP